MSDAITATDALPATVTENERSQDLGPVVGISLGQAGDEGRAGWVREHLLPHLEDIEAHDAGNTSVYERSPAADAAVTEAAWMQSQCCSWATFEVELTPVAGTINWHERADADEKTLFDRAIESFDVSTAP